MRKTRFCAFVLAAILILVSLPSAAAASAERPAWFPEDLDSLPGFYDSTAPRIVDFADVFSPEEEAAIQARIDWFCEKYSTDFVVVTDVTTYELGADDYSFYFYKNNGYGVEPRYSGNILFISFEPGNRTWWSQAFGEYEYLFGGSNYNNVNVVDDAIEPYMHSGDYADGVIAYIEKLGELYEYEGELPAPPLTFADFKVPILAGLGGGLIIALIVLFMLIGDMRKIAIGSEAGAYIVPGSFILSRSADHYLYSSVTRTKREKSGSGGGSSFSSHSSGSHSSSGGGGRSF